MGKSVEIDEKISAARKSYEGPIGKKDPDGLKFGVMVPGLELPRVMEILDIFMKENGFVYKARAVGGYQTDYTRIELNIACTKKKHAVDLRRRLGCRFTQARADLYFIVDRYGRNWSYPPDYWEAVQFVKDHEDYQEIPQ